MKVTKHTKQRLTKGRIGPVVAALVAVLSGVAAAGYFVDDALAAPGPAAPSITSEPSNPTTSTSAAFTFTDSSSPVTFKCSLDSAAFATCSSGVSYSGLAQGSHTFKVEAVSGSSTSSTTSYSWAIVPPTPTITSEPSNPTTATSASFKYSDTLAGVSFLCSLNGSSFSSCVLSGVTYTVSNGGSNTFSVEAQVGSNTPSAAAPYTWTVTTPTPTINSKPANPTNSTSATFTYIDTQDGDTFKCSLDGASYSTCPSGGVTYTGLSNATHTFGVEATLGRGPASSVASYSWLVHTTAPTITLTFPASGSYYNAAGWAAGCSPVGVCGTASDPVGVTSVGVAVLQQSSGKYWNGSSFSSSSQVFNTATGTTTWDYPMARPADGTYTLYVRATDTLGNTTSSANLTTASFTIDTVAPAAPVISVEESTSTDTEFEFTDTGWPNVTFSCDLDSGTVMNCTGDTDHDGDTNTEGEWDFTNLAPGPHCFYVWATDKAGNVSLTSSYCWTVIGAPATITEVSGSPQSATVHSAFANPLVAKVTDSHGDPVPGASVTFSAPTSGASGTFSNGSTTITGTTGSNGEVSETFTANTTAGGPYTVKASVTGVSSAANFSLTNTPAATSKLVFSTEPPTSTAATSTFSTTVTIEDTYGNVETGDTSTVALSLSTNPCSGTLGGTTSKAASAGVLTFSGLQITKACTGYVLKATDATDGSISITSNAFNIVAGAASTIAVSSGSGQSATVHSAFAKPLVALVTDTYGNPVSGVTVTFTPPGSGGSGTFTTTNTAVTGTNGLATSTVLTANTVAGTYNVVASASGAGSVNFSETNIAGTATTIAVVSGSGQSAPVSTAFGSPLVAKVTDTYGNAVSGSSVTFGAPSSGASATFAACASNPHGYSCVATTGSNGQATSSVFTANATPGGYSISASALGTNTVTYAETNTATVATAIAVYSGNNQSATVATSFGNALVAQVTASGNPIAGVNVTFSAPTTGASGTFFAPCSGGNNATFTTCTVTSGAGGLAVSSTFTANTVAGGPYTVTATASGVTTPAGFSLTNTAGKASKLVYTTQPPASTPATSTFGVTLTIEDAYGNTVTSDTNLVGLTLSTNTCGGSLGGTTSQAAVSGVATFSNLQIVRACVGYQVTATDSSDSLTSSPSSAFTITAGAPNKIVYNPEPPTTGTGGSTLTSFGVSVEDTYGNIETTGTGATDAITLSLATKPAGGAFNSASSTYTSVAAVNGTATFSGVVLDTAGSYTFTATDTTRTLPTVTSTPPTVISPAKASQLVFSTQPPSSPIASTSTFGVAVTIEDAYGNVETSDSNSVGLTLTTNPCNGSLSGTNPEAASSGVATFSNLQVATACTGYRLTAIDGTDSLTSPLSNPFTITAAAPSKLVYNPEPPTTGTAGSTLTSFAVSVEDTYGNIETTGNTGASDAITLSLATEPAGGVFNSVSGTYTNVAAVNGTATFSGVILDTAGSYTFTATDNTRSLPTVTSAPPTVISPTTPNNLVFNPEPPTTGTAGSTLTSFSVSVEDTYGNIETTGNTGASDPITLSLATKPTGGAFNSASSTYTNVAAVNGTASFSGVVLDTAGSYTFTATDSTRSLPAVTSTPPTVISPTTPSKLVNNPEPPTTGTAGTTLTSFGVSIEDTYGNIETTGTGASDAITLSLATKPTGGAFNSAPSTTSVVALNGTATFSGIVLDTAGSYTFTATDSTRTLPTVTSTPPTVIGVGTPYAITVVSGNNQSATQGVGFANPLVVKVTDQHNNPVSGASVKFSAPSSGASGTFSNSLDTITAPTLSDGTLSEGFTANNTGGPYTVTATTGTLTPADFSLLNGMNFSISGNAGAAFYPGTTQSVDLSITNPNPNSDELTVNSSSLSLVVTPDASHSGCQASWFTLNKGSWSVTVQGGSSESLATDLHVATGNLPTVTMTDTNTDQDACQGANLTLHWSANGSGTP